MCAYGRKTRTRWPSTPTDAVVTPRSFSTPAAKVVLATPVTAGCRMIKSPAEIANMQYANDITLAAFKAGLATLREGMTQGELGNNITAAFRQMGANGAIAVSFGKY